MKINNSFELIGFPNTHSPLVILNGVNGEISLGYTEFTIWVN